MKSRILFKIALALSVAGAPTPTVFSATGDVLASDDLKVQPGASVTVAAPPTQHLKVRLSWGHRSASARTFRIGFRANGVAVTQTHPDGFARTHSRP